MSLDSWNGVIEHDNESGQNCLMEVLLELLSHIVSDLTKAMKGRVSDLGNWVLKVLDDNWDHGGDLRNVVDVLTNLGECHKAGVLVSPVVVVSKSSLNKLTQKRKHNLLTNSRDESIDTALTKVD